MKTKRHAHQWREAQLHMNKTRGAGMVIQCATCAEIEFLNERAAREFRRQIELGIEPHFDSEGLVPVVIQQRSGPSRANRKRNAARGNA